MTNFEAALHKGEQAVTNASSESPATAPVNAGDNHRLINSRPREVSSEFGTPMILGSTEDLHPQGAFSPEGPPAKCFDSLGANQQRVQDNVIYATKEDADGTQRRVIRDFNKDNRIEDVIHPDNSTELIKSERDFLERKTFYAGGRLRSDVIDDDRANRDGQTKDSKRNVEITRQYDEHGNVIENNNRWSDSAGKWHEDNFMKMEDGSTYHVVMDDDVTTKKFVKADGSWTNTVQTMNVDKVDAVTGRHYKTMTVEYTESPQSEKMGGPQ